MSATQIFKASGHAVSRRSIVISLKTLNTVKYQMRLSLRLHMQNITYVAAMAATRVYIPLVICIPPSKPLHEQLMGIGACKWTQSTRKKVLTHLCLLIQ